MSSSLLPVTTMHNLTVAVGLLPSLLTNSSYAGGKVVTISTATPTDVTNASTAGVNDSRKGPPWELTIFSEEHLISTSVILGLMILCCIIGNCFVIAAVILERSLHNVANYLILSLAVADLMVAVLVMPLSVVSEISEVWFLHSEVCHMWISFDVLCCTASILHLVAIALDRYWAVTSLDYMRRRTARRILLMILAVWVVALSISIPPLFGWRDTENDPEKTGLCIISQDHGYTIFSTVGAFYLPMFIMICIYARIYTVARARIRKEKFLKNYKKNGATKSTPAAGGSRPTPETKQRREHISLAVTNRNEYSVVSNCNGCSPEKEHSDVHEDTGRHKKNGTSKSKKKSKDKEKNNSDVSGDNDSVEGGGGGGSGRGYTNGGVADDPMTVVMDNKAGGGQGDGAQRPCLPSSRHRDKLEQKRERKAARTLAIITSAFIICWLPFFILALIGPFIRDKVHIPPLVDSILLWLGYVNSLLNPIIYTIFSPEFRSAFQKILFGKYSRKARARSR